MQVGPEMTETTSFLALVPLHVTRLRYALGICVHRVPVWAFR